MSEYTQVYSSTPRNYTYELLDVSLTARTDNDVLAWDTTTGKWTNQTLNDVGLRSTALVLLSSTTIALNANADTTIYTVPTGFRCVLNHAVLVAGSDAGATTTIAIGQDTAETDFIPANTLSNLDAANDAVILMPIPNTTPLKIKSYAAGTVIQAQVGTQSGGATNTLYLFGYLYAV